MMTTTSKVISISYETCRLLNKLSSVASRGYSYRLLSSSHAKPIGEKTGAADGSSSGRMGGHGDPKMKVESSNLPPNPQEFVKIRFEPGQYDPKMKDPLYRPPWKTRAKIISEEDYVNRPTVGFSEQFASLGTWIIICHYKNLKTTRPSHFQCFPVGIELHYNIIFYLTSVVVFLSFTADARVTLSHMTHETKDKLYQDYLDLMEAMNQREKVTSHEYVVTVIARKYNIMPDRAAAIIQLAHNEERIKVDFPDREIHYEFAKKMDDAITRYIQEVYAQYDEVPPTDFVEEAWEYTGKGSSENVHVDDLLNLDELSRQAIVRDREHAQKLIDTKVYKEDYDSSQVEVKINQECQKLMKAHDEMQSLISTYGNALSDAAAHKQLRGNDVSAENATVETGVKVMEQKPSRSFKFVAHAINTNEARKKKSNRKKYKDHSSIIVEQNGILRAPTEEEVECTSWKSRRNVKEFILKGAKRGWLDRKHKGIMTAWGRAPISETKSAAVDNA